MATSYESTWQTRVREMVKVDEEGCSRGATGDEGRCIQNAVREYSRHRPRKLTYQGAAPEATSVLLADLISGWSPSYSLAQIYTPDRRTQADRNEVDTYTDSDGATVLWFSSQPSGELWLEYTAPHVLTPEVVAAPGVDPVAGVDTIASEAAGDYDAICHLAGYYVMQHAADFYVRQFAKSLGAGDYSNYIALAEKHLREYQVHMGLIKPEGAGSDAAGVQPYSGRVDWDSRTTGGSDRFAHRGRWF